MVAAASESGGENPFHRAMEDWRARTPLVCRLIAQGIVVCYAVSWLVDLRPTVACVPYRVVHKGEVHRLVLSPLVGNSLLGSFFACITIGDGVGPKLERSLGSASYAALALLSVTGINVAFVIFCFGAAAGGSLDAVLALSAGVWGPLMALITVESLSAPEATRRLLFLPVELPRLYYPLALGGIIILFSGGPEIALGVGLGYAEHFGYLATFRPSAAAVARLESVRWLHSLVANPAYVTGRAALGAAAWVQLTQDAAWGSNDRQPSGFASMLEALRRRVASAPDDTSAGAPAARDRFPDSAGHVLGATAVAPGTATVPTPARTAAANRATILAAAEKRAQGAINA